MTEHLSPTALSTARESLDSWLTMWNADGDIARQICADDFRIHFAVTEPDGSTPADDIRTSGDFANYLRWWHDQNPGVVFTSVADAIDGSHGRLLWDVRAGDALAGGCRRLRLRRERSYPTGVVGRRAAEHAELTQLLDHRALRR